LAAPQGSRMAPLDAPLHRKSPVVTRPDSHAYSDPGCITIGLVNNMPDAEFWNTERQFYELLTVSRRTSVRLRYFVFDEISRSEAVAARIGERYEPIEALWESRVDGLVVTGAEPRSHNLKNEPFWPTMARLVAWSRERTVS